MFGPSILIFVGLAIPAIAAWFAATSYYHYRQLSHIPGPRGAGWSKWWFIRATLSGRTHLDLYEVCEKYGSISRVGPRHIVTSDPKLVLHMLGTRSKYTRSSWYNGFRFDPKKSNIICVRDEAIHNTLRSKMAGGYSGKEVENLELKIDNAVHNLLNLLDSYVSTNKPFDLARKIHYFTLDVIASLAFGESFGNLTSDSDARGYIGNIEQYLPTLIISTALTWIIPFIGLPIFRPLMPSEHDVLGVGRFMALAKDIAASRYGPKKKVQKDMVGSFVAKGLTQAQIESEVAAQVVAGTDTTATALRAIFLYVISTPRVLAKLQAEIREHNLSWPIATDAEIRQLPYLQATIKEGLRVFPPVAGFMGKDVPADGDSWNGIAFPPGTKIGISMWGVFRQKSLWGADADEFRPERWLDASPEMETVLGLIFGAGKWGCLGKSVAQIELNKVLFEVLRRFDLTLLNPTQPWKSRNCAIFLQSDFWVRGHARQDTLE